MKGGLASAYRQLQERHARLEAENVRLRKAVRNQQGDALCWIDDPSCQQVQALPQEEFLESCRRYHGQISATGVAEGLPTITQLEAEIVHLTERIRVLQDVMLDGV